MSKTINRIFNMLGRSVDSTVTLYVSKLRSKCILPQRFLKKINAAIKKTIQGVMRLFWGRPSSLEDYFHINDARISKQLVARLSVLLVALGIVWVKFAYPYINGRLWPAKMVVNTSQYHEFTGKGNVYYPDGVVLYKGEMVNGQAEGKGELYDEAGSLVYQGDFSQNKYNGDGTLYEKGQMVYRGQFVDNVYEGMGEAFFKNGNTAFRGQFASGVYLQGDAYYASGRKKYSGAFENGLYTGEGTMYDNSLKNGLIYTGAFLNGRYDGMGTLYRDGVAVYEGAFRNGYKNGEGRAYSPNGKYLIYEGSFKDDLYNGTGTLYHTATGRCIYKGEFLQGIYQGQGILYASTGQKVYEGIFYDGTIDYMHYTNVDETEIKDAFGKEDDLIMLDSSYLLVYKNLGVAFELGYVEFEETPAVERIRFFGEQDINGVSLDTTLKRFRDMFRLSAEDEINELYTEYSFVAEESETALTEYMQQDIQPGDLLYTVKCIFDEYYIRAYATEENGKICYFEAGGI